MRVRGIAMGRRLTSGLAILVLSLHLMSPGVAGAMPRMARLTLVVPAAAGGGWDLTAKAMKATLESEDLVGQVSIVRYPGAGGLVGLSQFVDAHRGQDDVLLVGGLVMLSSALRDEAAVTLRDVIPIARLTGEWSLLVVRNDSPFHSVGDVISALKRDPAAVRWLGGALGGPDQATLWLAARELHVPIEEMTYFGRAGGRRVSEALLDGRGDVGVSGYAEFAPRIGSGELRILGIAAPDRVRGIEAPTLREAGLDVSMMNWRGVFAAPGLAADKQDRLIALIADMVHSAAWTQELRANRWSDTYLAGSALLQFIDREQGRWSALVDPLARADDKPIAIARGSMSWPRLTLLLVAVGALGMFACSLFLQLRRRRRLTTDLERRCGELAERLKANSVSAGKLVKDGIDIDFSDWKLSGAESDVAWLMLRGLPFREVAELRGTSERTVRQQAQAIYRKAGLDGRSDLAGRVLERFI